MNIFTQELEISEEEKKEAIIILIGEFLWCVDHHSADLDMAIPHISTQTWIKSLNMKIEDPWRAWFVDGQVAG